MKLAKLCTVVLLILTVACPKPEVAVEKHVTLPKAELFINDDVRRACSTDIKFLNRNDRAIGEKIKQIITGAGPLRYDNKKRSVCADALANDMHEAMQTQKAAYGGNSLVYDLVVIGAGVHASIFNVNHRKTHPDTKTLVIDKSSVMAEHFRSKAFRINSPLNPPDKPQTNNFPNAPVQLEDYLSIDASDGDFKQFPYAQALWNQTVFANFASSADFIMGVEVSSVTEETSNGETMFVVTAGEFGKIKAHKVILSSGLGTPKFVDGHKDYIAKQKALAESCKYEECLPQVMTFDDMLVIDAAWAAQNRRSGKWRSIQDAFSNKRIMLVGGGDATMVAWEFLYLSAVESLDSTNENNFKMGATVTLSRVPSQLKWINPLFTDKTTFDVAAKANPPAPPKIKARYNNFLAAGLLANQAGLSYEFIPKYHVTRVAGRDKEVVVTLEDDVKTPRTEEVDYVILATGYDNGDRLKAILGDILSAAEKKAGWEKLFPFLDIDAKRSARQLKTSQGNKEIYLIGTAAGVGGPKPEFQLATQEDIAASLTKNPASINVLAPYTERFANWLNP